MDRNYTSFDAWRKYLPALGVKHARIQGGWSRCEPAPDKFNFTWLDNIVHGMSAVKVKPWLQLSFGNDIYPGGGTNMVDSSFPTGVIAVAKWERWVNATVTRYTDYIDEWEIWNEPDLHLDAQDYAAFVISTTKVVLAAQSHARIFVQIASKTDFLNETLMHIKEYASNLLNSMAVTYHPYAYNPDQSYAANVRDTLAVVNFTKPGMQIRQGENGAPSARGSYGALSDYNWTETSQAKWALRRMLGDLGWCGQTGGIPTSLFSIVDMCYASRVNIKGLIETNCSDPAMPVVRPKEAYHAVQYLTSFIGSDTHPNCETTVQTNVTKSISHRAFNLGNGGATAVALWYSDETPANYDLELCHSDACCVTATFGTAGWTEGTPLGLADLRLGTVYHLPSDSLTWHGSAKVTISPVPFYDSPVIIAPLASFAVGNAPQVRSGRHA